MLSGGAYRPGDIVRCYNGKTVEITNTDAEGRMILADALAWAVEEGCDALVELSTLTGACVVALGHQAAGRFTPDDGLAAELDAAAAGSGERLWRLPLLPEFLDEMQALHADLRNSAGRCGRAASAPAVPAPAARLARAGAAAAAALAAPIAPIAGAPLLAIEGLEVTFPRLREGQEGEGRVAVVRGASLTVARGECVGLVGESGSGKSLLALAVLWLVPPPGRVRGRVVLDGHGRDRAAHPTALPASPVRHMRAGPLRGRHPR